MIDLIRRHPSQHEALVAPAIGERVGYGELIERIEAASGALRSACGDSGIAFLAMGPDSGAVVLYLACLHARIPACLVEPQEAPIARLVRAYAPELILLPTALDPPAGYHDRPSPVPGYTLWAAGTAGGKTAHPDLAVMLTTSGSTGSPKLVRLTSRNLVANALAIAEYLELSPGERAVQSLPMHYSYGLSVLNSHLTSGGSIALTPHSFMRPEFWAVVDGEKCTSFAGVPHMYETLHRLRFDPGRHATLRTLTQAGGALRPDLIEHFMNAAHAAGQRLFIMYGQTEATARISYVPPAKLPSKVGSIGISIPGGRLGLAPVEGSESMTEIVYEGPNVMMGYAESPADLALGDVQGGKLKTGDLGRADADGFFSVTGRLKRFAKLFGHRVSLEDIERDLEAAFPVRVAATDGGDRIVLHTQAEGEVGLDAMGLHVAKLLGVPPGAVVVRSVAALPRTSAGKKDYRALEVTG